MKNFDYDAFFKSSNKGLCDGVCLVQAYSKQPTKNGGSFIGGQISTSQGAIPFKAWSNSEAYAVLDGTNCSGKLVNLNGECNVYEGTKSLIITDITVLTDEVIKSANIVISDYMFSKYNTEAYWEKFVSTVRKNVSPEAFEVFNTILEPYQDAFKVEFAAINHHDNCKSGLLAHTLKVTQMGSMIKLYPTICEKIGVDLLYVGCALHDIGKVVEYSNGSISNTGIKLPHPVIGALIISENSKYIKDTMGEDFYNGLLSVVSSHHGEYGEPPRTLAAYVISRFDLLDSTLTSISELVEKSVDGRIAYDGCKLS